MRVDLVGSPTGNIIVGEGVSSKLGWVISLGRDVLLRADTGVRDVRMGVRRGFVRNCCSNCAGNVVSIVSGFVPLVDLLDSRLRGGRWA